MITIRKANTSDFKKVQFLLHGAHLPSEDLPKDLSGFLVAYTGELLIGSVGIEPYMPLGLLRSLVVNREFRSQQIGRKLVQRALHHAYQQGLRDIYLITEATEGYFKHLGFERIPRKNVPPPIQHTTQFSHYCPKEASVMHRVLQASDAL
ncbi:arsenic resistance N-acetyltransferase ArsN2 [Rapidithrix thailandica]|uniref:Arsenic resistance N-acetyltransferase ArsN2 n=1 Tax=Rapidithrix thailandica TaxID=413964 RepID=A0AAW9S522_9BACT